MKKQSIREFVKEFLKEAYRISTLRFLFPLQYVIHSRKPVKKGKAVFIESQLPHLSDSLRLIYQALERKEGYQLSVHCLRESFVSTGVFLKAALACLKDIADAEYIFLCYGSRVISCIPKRKGTQIVQTWHGCGAFKKFGLSSSDLIFGGSRRNYEKYPYYRNLDYVTVSSPEVIWAYEEAMGLKEDPCKVVPVGISRTDIFFDQEFLSKAKKRVQDLLPDTEHKKIILYAPTFRGNVSAATAPDQLDIRKMQKELQEDYILLIKHHPVIRKRPEIPAEAKRFAFDVTEELSIEELIGVSDICISDYSSLIYEYSLFERPMIFYAYDLAEYHDWRGFYYNYEELTPGPVFTGMDEMIAYIKEIHTAFDPEVVRAFKDKFMSACDGKATQRLLELLKVEEPDNGKK